MWSFGANAPGALDAPSPGLVPYPLSLLIPVVYRSNSVASFLSKVDLLNLIGLIEFPLFMRNVFKGTSDVQ